MIKKNNALVFRDYCNILFMVIVYFKIQGEGGGEGSALHP